MSYLSIFQSQRTVFVLSIGLRMVLLLYGLWQDSHSPIKYTDIDYFVFTDAARFMSLGQSPYERDTYRYTPLLAWLIYPTVWRPAQVWFSFGKMLFAVGDVAAGWMMFHILRRYSKLSDERALKFASIWLLNPMVATISTRGSSEGLLGIFVTALLWMVLAEKIKAAGLLLGFAVHFKIYPFIYAPSIVWWLDGSKGQAGRENKKRGINNNNNDDDDDDVDNDNSDNNNNKSPPSACATHLLSAFFKPQALTLAFHSLITFAGLNLAMFFMYGYPFLEHSYFYHLTRIDHRHNFSPYNTLLYLNSSPASSSSAAAVEAGSHAAASLELERLAFIPQLLLSAFFIPLALGRIDLPSTMLAQTFAFVTFNKVCTSQYFLWYMMFLPYYLPHSTMLRLPFVGITALFFWIAGQLAWLQQGFQLEFNGRSTFVPGLWAASIFFFVVNVCILAVIIQDTKAKANCASYTDEQQQQQEKMKKKKKL